MYTRATYQVTWSKSKRLWQMTHEAAFRTVFPAKKGTKRHSKHLISVSMSYLRHLDGIPKKWLSSRQLPFKDDVFTQFCWGSNIQYPYPYWTPRSISATRFGPGDSISATGFGPGGPYPLPDLDRGVHIRYRIWTGGSISATGFGLGGPNLGGSKFARTPGPVQIR